MTLLEALMTQTAEAPSLDQYRALLRQAAERHLGVDDPACAESIAAAARELRYDARQVRSDYKCHVQMIRLESQFSAAKLEEAERELEPLRKADFLYSVSGATPERFGYTAEAYHFCTRTKLLDDLREQRKAATTDLARAEIREKVEAVEAEAARLSSLRRVAEETLITLLSARDRITTARVRSARLFPQDSTLGA